MKGKQMDVEIMSIDIVHALNERLSEETRTILEIEKEAWHNKRLVVKWLWWQICMSLVVVFAALFILTPMFIGMAIISFYLDDGIKQMLVPIFLFSAVICSIGFVFINRRNPIDVYVSEEMKKKFGE